MNYWYNLIIAKLYLVNQKEMFMKKIVLAIGLSSLIMAGCAQSASEENNEEQESLQVTIDKQAEQIKEYEATIEEQNEKIEALKEEVVSLKETSGSGGKTGAEDYIVLFRGDDTASYVYPTIESYNKEQDLVVTIHNYVTQDYDIGLNSYRFEDDNKLLVLDYDENVKNVQGSAGTAIFLGSMMDSYFANFPDLIGIKLLMNGDGTEEVIGQAGSNEIFVREPFTYDPKIEW